MFQEIMKYYQSKTASVYKIKTGHYESKTNECIKEKWLEIHKVKYNS